MVIAADPADSIAIDAPAPVERPPAAGPGEDVAQFRAYARFLSVDPTQDRARFYDLSWQPALWGGGALIRCWGRLGTQGQMRADFYPDRAAAQADIERTVRRRLAHGYRATDRR